MAAISLAPVRPDGMPRTGIEAAIRARITPPAPAKHAPNGPTFGRRKLGGSQ